MVDASHLPIPESASVCGFQFDGEFLSLSRRKIFNWTRNFFQLAEKSVTDGRQEH